MTNGKAGLAGTTAARMALLAVRVEQSRLVYQGIEVFELAGSSTFEETTYLIRNGNLPNVEQLEPLNRQLSDRHPPREVVDLIGSLSKGAMPMDVLRTANRGVSRSRDTPYTYGMDETNERQQATEALEPSGEECEVCETEMYGLHCKLVCPNCGYRRDCSDP